MTPTETLGEIAVADPPVLLADHMLTRLGRWLRAAGYDCAFPADGASDREVLAQAVAEDRLLADPRTPVIRLAGNLRDDLADVLTRLDVA